MRITAFILMLTFAAAAQAEVYRWVDEDGTVHYSETPPAGAQTQKVAPPSTPTDPSGGNYYEDYLEQRQQQQAAREAAEQEAQEKKQELAAKAKECQDLAGSIEFLETHPQIKLQQEDGNVVFLTEEQRQSRITERRAQYQEHCATPSP